MELEISVLAPLAEDQDWIPSTHLVAYSHL